MRKIFNSTTFIFLAIVALVAVWIGSGMVSRDPPTAPRQAAPRVPTVAASWSDASEITRELVLYGDVEPNQVSTLRARTDGLVETVADQGARVEVGDVLVQLSADDREARLARADAQVASAQRDYDAARQLADRNVGTEAEAQTRLAQLEAARAELRAIELEIGNTRLEAPIGGVVNRVIADIGAYVSLGGEILEIVDNDPLVAVVHVQQADIARVTTGMEARVRFIGGDERDGAIRFISPLGDAATRTFRVEVEVANPQGEVPAGLSAEVVIPTDTISAHRISAALGRLDEQGRVGILVVDDRDRVQFAPVEVIRARADGIWVAGLPDRVRIVTISQGSLSPGRQVEVHETPEEYLGRSGDPGVAAGDAISSEADGAPVEDGQDGGEPR